MVMRVGGLASGMDIDSLVEKLMAAEKSPLNKLQQKKQTFEWQRDAYRDVNTKLKTFDTYVADNLVIKHINSKTASTTNSDLVSAVATGKAAGTLSIEGVSQLATSARGVSDKQISATGSTKLSDLGITEDSISIRAIQADGTMATKATKIEIEENMTVNQFIDKINTSSAGVSAIFESGKLSITAKNTGDVKDGDEVVVDAGASVFGKLGFSSLTGDSGILASGGTNAVFEVNGIATERSTNNFTLNGYNVTLKGKFNADSSVTLSSTTNVDEMMDKVKEFVKTYNGLIKDLSDQTKQTKYRDFAPLTDDQRKEMEENEIKLWEEKAKSGLLRNDSLVRTGLSNMRALVYQTNPGLSDSQYNSLYSIGITTTKNYNDGGQLEINEDKLRKAIESDPDAVERLFKNSEGKKDAIIDGKAVDTRGYVDKLRESMKNFEISIENKAGRSTMTEQQYTIGKNLVDTNKRIDSWKTKLTMIEERYWKQFNAMESAISKSNNQSAMLFPPTQ